VLTSETLSVERRAPSLIGEKEPRTPRLCVAPTVAACFAARLFEKSAPVRVYAGEFSAIKPCSVWDAKITGERWAIPPHKLTHVHTVPADIVLRTTAAHTLYHGVTKRPSDARLRVCQYAIAVQYLGGTAFEEQFVADWLKYLRIDDPEEYVVSRAIKDGSPRRSLR